MTRGEKERREWMVWRREGGGREEMQRGQGGGVGGRRERGQGRSCDKGVGKKDVASVRLGRK